jgi:hypothetical protein
MLKKLIKYYWVLQSQSPVEINHKLLPVSNIDFILNLSSPIRYLKDEKTELVPKGFHFNGIRDRHYLIRQEGKLRVLGISFFPTGLFPVLKVPVSEFKGKTIELELALNNFTEIIMDKISTTKSILEIINIIEEQLIQNVNLALIPSKEILGLFKVFSDNSDVYNIGCFCEQHGMNQRG